MKLRFLKDLTLALLIAFLLSSLMFPSVVHAQGQWTGVCVGDEITGGEDVATLQGVQCLIANAFSVIITVIGLAGFVMFIIGSFRWMLSGGNTKGTETARNTMTFAVIGIVVALSGFIILNLIASFTGIRTITRFVIPSDNVRAPPAGS